jgi:hypothetical protein
MARADGSSQADPAGRQRGHRRHGLRPDAGLWRPGRTQPPAGHRLEYDPAKDEWSQLPSNPEPVNHGASVAIGRKFYVFGGFRLPKSEKPGWY